MEGILPVYKPIGITSYDVIRRIKKLGIVKKIGHAGTLDPFAEGILLILLGRSATKRMNEMSCLKKTYVATARLGACSDTMDCTGKINIQQTSVSAGQWTSESVDQLASKLQEIIPQFVGEIEQKVPEYSAAKVAGKPRYKYARAGVEVPSTSKKVTIYSLHVVKVDKNEVTIEATVSSGTYIRQLSYDLFISMGIESYLTKLVRTKIGEIGVAQCISLEKLSSTDVLQNKLLAQVLAEAIKE